MAGTEVMEKLNEFNSPFGVSVVKLIEAFRSNYKKIYGLPHPPLHDPCAVFYVLERESFHGRPVRYEIRFRLWSLWIRIRHRLEGLIATLGINRRKNRIVL